MAFLTTAHVGDVHLEEDHYFGDTAQCLEWFVADAIRSNVDLFVVNGDLTRHSRRRNPRAAVEERSLGLQHDHRPSLIVSRDD